MPHRRTRSSGRSHRSSLRTITLLASLLVASIAQKQQAPSPTSSRRQQEKISTVVMPFVDGVTQPLQWVLKPLNIRVVGKPATWKWCLQHLLKDSSNRDEEPGVVYRLTCNDCDQTYIGETGRTAIKRAKEHASYVRNGRFDMSAAADHAIIHQHSLSFKTVQIVDHEPRAARRRVKEALHIRTENLKNPMNKDKGLELDTIWFSVVWIFSYRDRFYANFPNSEPSTKLLRFFPFALFTLYLSFFYASPSSCFLVTLDTLRLIHKTPTSTPNVTFPQLRRDDAPHLPDSSRKRTSRFKKVGIFFFCCLLENGWGNPVETSCFATLTAGVVRKKY